MNTQPFRSIFDAINDAIFIYDFETGEILDVNSATCEMYGYTYQEMLQLNIVDLALDEAPYTAADALARTKRAAQGKPQICEWKTRDKRGRFFWIEVSMRLAVIDGKNRLLATVRDISIRKQLEAQLEQSLRQIRVRYEVSQALTGDKSEEEILDIRSQELAIYPEPHILIATFDTCDGELFATTRRVSEHSSSLRTAMPLGARSPVSQFGAIHDHLSDPVFISDNVLADTRLDRNSRDIVTRVGGKALAVFQLRANGQIIGIISIVAESTAYFDEEKLNLYRTVAEQGAAALRAARLREAIHASHQRVSLLVEQSPLAVIEWTLGQEIVSWNPAATRIFGYEREEALGRHAVGFLTPVEMKAELEQSFRNLLENKVENRILENGLTKDGRRIVCEWFTSLLIGSDGEPVGAVSVVTDITERRRAEVKVHKSEERLREAVRTGNISVYESDYGSNKISWMPDQYEAFGWEAGEVETTEQFISWVHPNDRQRISDATERAHDPEGDGLLNAEYRVVLHSGEIRWLRHRSRTLFEGDGSERHAVRTIGAVSDITEQKQIEIALRESEGRYRALIQSQTDLISRYRPDCILTFVNDAYCQFYGKSQEELIGQSYLTMVAPEFREITQRDIEALAKEPQTVSGEYLNYSADGQEHWIHWVVQGITDETGQVVELQAIGHDITRLKRTEESLRISEERLRQAVKVGDIGIFEQDYKTDTVYWSPEQRRIWGWEVDDAITQEAFLKGIHPDDLPLGIEKTERSRNPSGDGLFDMEHRIIHPDGGIRWLHVRSQTFFKGEENECILSHTIGATIDITEPKQQEQALRRYNQRLSILRDMDRYILSARSVSEVVSAVLEQLTQLIACDWTGIALFDEALSQQQVYGWHPGTGGMLDVHDPQPVASGDLFKRLESGESVVHDELDISAFEQPGMERQFVGQGMRSVMTNPLMVYGRLTGCLVLLSQQAHLFTPDYVQLAEAVATQAALALHRVDLNERLARQNIDLERRVAERTQELQEANDEIKHFAYIVSHDLRAPLVNLKGFAAELRTSLRTVKDDCLDMMPLLPPDRQERLIQALQEDVPEALQYIESSVSNMDSFTRAILKLSRLGRLQLDIVMVDVGWVVRKTLDALGYQIAQQHIRVTVGHLPKVEADLVSMEQIFTNILSNAVAYLVPDRPGEIEIGAETNASETVFFVRDNGRGIAKEDMSKVFAPFRRAGKQDVPGEGIGLAYVQTLVRRHGGRIWCESTPNLGTTFRFTISRDLMKELTQKGKSDYSGFAY